MTKFMNKMRVAVEGCCHGCLDQIYRSISKKKVDLLIICGDFQSIRNRMDLQSMSVPDKYKKMGNFQDYYTGKKKAPVFTIFIGGNHEASNYLEELKYGGFVAPNIYYLGRTSVIWYKGLRIGGMSGVYWKKDFMNLAPQSYNFPYDRSTIRSIYHYRKDDYLKLYLMRKSNKMIMISHDWPEGIYDNGDVKKLLKNKPFFREDIKNHCLGSPFNMELLKVIQPNYWFSAHLHVRFVATINWDESFKSNETESKKRVGSAQALQESTKKACFDRIDEISNDEIVLDMDLENDHCDELKKEAPISNDEIVLDMDIANNHCDEVKEDVASTVNGNEIMLSMDINSSVSEKPTNFSDPLITATNGSTKFLALDKCLPRRNFLEVLDIALTDKNHLSTKDPKSPLYYDEEYISSLKVVEKHKMKLNELSYENLLSPPANFVGELNASKEYYLKEYQALSGSEYEALFKVSLKSFVKTASVNEKELKTFINPQTEAFVQNFLK